MKTEAFDIQLPPVVKPEQAYKLDMSEQARAGRLVETINSQLKNLAFGSKKRIGILEPERSAVYGIVLRHFRQAWNVTEADRWQGGQDPRDSSGIYWEFSAPKQYEDQR